MVRLELTPEEVGTLRQVLESYLSDLHREIAGTDNRAYRADLKKTEAFLRDLLQRLTDGASLR
jgi:hypothetical protein